MCHTLRNLPVSDAERNACYANDIFDHEFTHSKSMSGEELQMVCEVWMEIDLQLSKHINKWCVSVWYSKGSNGLFTWRGINSFLCFAVENIRDNP